jgi:hypothetical protein
MFDFNLAGFEIYIANSQRTKLHRSQAGIQQNHDNLERSQYATRQDIS